MTQPVTDAMREASRLQTGQFGTQVHADPGIVDLWDPTDGSYAFPPIPKIPSDVIDFWKTIEIPDDVLETVVKRSSELVYQIKESIKGKVYAEHDQLWRRINNNQASRADVAHWEEVKAEAECAAEDHSPSIVPRAFAKPIFRLASIAYWARYLPAEQRNMLLETPFKLPGGQITTPETIWDRYSFDTFYDKLITRPTEAETSTAMLEMATNITWLKNRGNEQRIIERTEAERKLAHSGR